MVRLITAADLVDGARGVLVAQIPDVLEQLGLDAASTPAGALPYRPPTRWDQVPDLAALQAATMPAGCIVARGTVGEPKKSTLGTRATWRLEVAVFDRDRDFTPTADRVSTWAGVLRAVMLRNPTLGGVAESVSWAGESYRPLRDNRGARTLGGCVVEINATAVNVVDLDDWPLVTDPAPPDLTVR